MKNFILFIFLCLLSLAYCIRNGKLVHARRAENRAQVSLQDLNDDTNERFAGANLVHSSFVLGSIIYLKKCRTSTILARIGSLDHFQGGQVRQVVECKMFQHHKVEDDRMSMMVGRLATPYRTFGMHDYGFMAHFQFRPRCDNLYTNEKERFLAAGWFGSDKNWAGQTLSAMLVDEIHVDKCDKYYEGLGRYTPQSVSGQFRLPLACYGHAGCTSACADRTHPMKWDDGNGVYCYETNVLVAVLQTTVKPKNQYWDDRNGVSSFVENVGREVVPYMTQHAVDELADFPEFKGMFW